MGCKELSGVSNGYMGLPRGEKVLQVVTGCYGGVTGGCRVKKGLQGVTGGYRGFYGVTRSYRVLLCDHKG